jgi:hypothetical protein
LSSLAYTIKQAIQVQKEASNTLPVEVLESYLSEDEKIPEYWLCGEEDVVNAALEDQEEEIREIIDEAQETIRD